MRAPNVLTNRMAKENGKSLKKVVANFRAKAFQQLHSVTGLSPEDCREAFLFDDERFCGVRWSLGEVTATWRSGTEQIDLSQGGNRIRLPADQQVQPIRRAA